LGSRLGDDIAYTQKLSRHRNLMAILDTKPMIDNAFVANNSTLVGDVQVGSWSSIWYNAVLRAEWNPIRIGSYTSIGDSTVLSSFSTPPMGVSASITIGNHVIIQHNCTILSCIIDDEVFIGAGSTIGEGCKIEKGAIVAPNSFVPPGRLIPGGQLWSGNPVKFVKELSDKEMYSTYMQSYNMWNTAQSHNNDFNLKKDDEFDLDASSTVESYLSENYIKWRARYYDP
jgi:carbonic anhydrase/acetyltransferase-like protein (isoleucine patch superfamily)